jgi:SAM-dependent methyltransferase
MASITLREALKRLILRIYKFAGLASTRELTRELGALSQQLRVLDPKVLYLMNEASNLRALMRYLLPESADYQQSIQETGSSFDYQFRCLDKGVGLLSDPGFKTSALSALEQFTRLPNSWFVGKKVLDAGCGNGRWSYFLSVCKADVTAIDNSTSAVEATREACKEFPGFRAKQHDLLNSLAMPEAFDLVWSFGVVHHTGNTKRAVTNLADCVKPGGYLFLMVYGEPRWDHYEDFDEINEYVALRRKLVTLPFDERANYLRRQKTEAEVHGWFDAVSPRVNDLHRFDEIAEWLHLLKFTDVQITFPNRNLFIMARRS